MTRVDFRVNDGAAARYDALIELRRWRVTNAEPAFEDIAEDIEHLEDAVFRTQGRLLTAGGWKPVSERQRALKARRGLSQRPLEMAKPGELGRLRRSLTETGAPYSVRRVTNDVAERGTRLGIAKVHQRGGTTTISRGRAGRQTVRIPRRRFMQARPVDRLRWLGVLEDHLQGSRRGRSRRRRRMGL